MTMYAVAVGVADVWSEPDDASERVTQALMNVPVDAARMHDCYTRVTLPDYEGWMRSADLEEPIVKGFCKVSDCCGTPLDFVAVVTATHAPLYAQAEGDEAVERLYLSTALPLLDLTHERRLCVALPGERTGWLARECAVIRRGEAPYPPAPASLVSAYARAFLGVHYLWGGTSWRGIDCSALVQLCYRMGGYILPRDADQQHDALARSVGREEMREGDLIFFGRHSVTHVALALNEREYIHAEGQRYNRVVINSFDPADACYDQHLFDIARDLKRVVK
jgi:cell wall-associated NlpC family hydrolase